MGKVDYGECNIGYVSGEGNSELTEKFSPCRGLRQGDPLSPYLFLLCMEWLSQRLLSNMNSGTLKGITVCQGAPMISHLFFADESILFLQATDQNTYSLKNSLEDYQLISGQRINFSKSEVVFSPTVSSIQKEIFVSQFGVQQVPFHAKYLGLLLGSGRAKTDKFQFLVERTRENYGLERKTALFSW